MSKRSSLQLLKHNTEMDVFQAIADPTRRKLVQMLAEKEMPITAMTKSFELSRTAVNKHLNVLFDAGLVDRQKVGRETRYRFRPEPLSELKQWLAFFERYWDNKLSALQHYVESDND